MPCSGWKISAAAPGLAKDGIVSSDGLRLDRCPRSDRLRAGVRRRSPGALIAGVLFTICAAAPETSQAEIIKIYCPGPFNADAYITIDTKKNTVDAKKSTGYFDQFLGAHFENKFQHFKGECQTLNNCAPDIDLRGVVTIQNGTVTYIETQTTNTPGYGRTYMQPFIIDLKARTYTIMAAQGVVAYVYPCGAWPQP